jgi:signal transduction histidine kinase
MSHAVLAVGVVVVYIGLTFSVFWWSQAHPIPLIRQAHETGPLAGRLLGFIVLLGVSFPLALLVAGLAASRVTSKALEPLDRMIHTADCLTAKRFDVRLPVVDPADEPGRLAVVINALMGRIQAHVDQMQRFTSDVSHELRIPLTALLLKGEIAMRRPGDQREVEDVIGNMLEEVHRLKRLVDNLLMISRMDANLIDLNLAECDIVELLRQSLTLLTVLAEEKSQLLLIRASGKGVVHADEVLLRQAFINVIHNAIKFTPEGGLISVDAYVIPSIGIDIHVDDQGPGIPEGDRERIFERFSRLSPVGAGSGLGLAIVKRIVEGHHGEVSVSRNSWGGSRFTIRVPYSLSASPDNAGVNTRLEDRDLLADRPG